MKEGCLVPALALLPYTTPLVIALPEEVSSPTCTLPAPRLWFIPCVNFIQIIYLSFIPYIAQHHNLESQMSYSDLWRVARVQDKKKVVRLESMCRGLRLTRSNDHCLMYDDITQDFRARTQINNPPASPAHALSISKTHEICV